jgi:putative transcriptional regulator
METIKGRQPHRRLRRREASHPPYWLFAAQVRHRLNINRTEFANRFGISVNTLRHWEEGRRRPRGAALVLLHLIWRNPRAVMQAVSRACQVEIEMDTLMPEHPEDAEEA